MSGNTVTAVVVEAAVEAMVEPEIKVGKLFPPFIGRGWEGRAVDTLHQILMMLGHGEGIQRNEEYDEVTIQRVVDLQHRLGLKSRYINGNFGPRTRALLKEKLGIDVDAIMESPDWKEVTKRVHSSLADEDLED